MAGAKGPLASLRNLDRKLEGKAQEWLLTAHTRPYSVKAQHCARPSLPGYSHLSLCLG